MNNTIINIIKVKEDYRIEPYRDAFRSLDMNPNKFMCSIEALVSRVAKGNKLPSINPIVDLTNAISLKYLIPLGAHNIDSFDGDIELRYTNGNDCFIPINKTTEEAEFPENELVYVSGNDIKTRRWTWRQGNNGKIIETTSNIFIPLDGFKNFNQEELVKARDELALIFKNQLNAKVQVGLVDKDNNIYKF